MVSQLLVHIIHQQDRRRAGLPPGRHIINRVPDHDQPAGVGGPVVLAEEAPVLGNVQDARGVGLGGPEVARDDRVEVRALEELGQQVLDGHVKVAGADGLGDLVGVEVGHEGEEARLRRLRLHGLALDGADGVEGRVLGFRGEGLDVFEDVGGFLDAEGVSHLFEHICLRLTVRS